MLFVDLAEKYKRSYTQQIYKQIRKKILNGELKADEQLPSTRSLSNELGVSRNTVSTAYDMLVSEGYARGVSGSGMYVNNGAQAPAMPEKIADYHIASLSTDEVSADIMSFDSGMPDLNLFPRHKWNKAAAQAFKQAPVSALGYDYPQGRPELRRVLADYLKKTRGIYCHPEQIIITSGTKQGLSLVAKCLLNQNNEVWLEDPTNQNVRQIFAYHTNHIVPIAVDAQGIQPDLFPPDKKPDLIFVTPSHQFPMGGVLPIQRRVQLTNFAKTAGCYILEDDYDNEFRYAGAPANALYELSDERVIYAGTFSKILFPSLRLGYLVLPYPLIEQCREYKRLGDHHSNSINQLALLRFIESGELERHIMRTKKIYGKRREILLSLLDQYFPGQVKVHGAPVGMHIVAEFDQITFSPELIERLKAAKVAIVPVENHTLVKGKHLSQIILGYAHLSPERMEQGLMRLKAVLAG